LSVYQTIAFSILGFGILKAKFEFQKFRNYFLHVLLGLPTSLHLSRIT